MSKSLTSEDIKWLLTALKKVDFFATVSAENIDKIIAHFTKYEYPKDEIVIKEGEPGTAFYIIKSGMCLVYRKKWLFGKKKIAILKEGDFFGEMSLIFSEPASATVKTLTPSEIFVYFKTDFLQLLSENKSLETEIRYIAEKRKYEIKK